MKSRTRELHVGTFNVRGLTKDEKKANLATDMERYKVDVCCLQETKIKTGCDTGDKKYRLICLPTKNEHYGMGFMIRRKWMKYVHKVWKENDRIAVLQLKSTTTKEDKKKEKTNKINNKNKVNITKNDGLKTTVQITKKKIIESWKSTKRKMKMKFAKVKKKPRQLITIINVYGPHSEITRKKPEEAEVLYDKIEEVLKKTKKGTALTVIAGDFNSEIGRRTEDDTCIGKYSSGKRNNNGEEMINFCERNELQITNTCFQHSQRHRTTWEQTQIHKRTNELKHIRKTLDYIMIPKQYNHILQDSRSYQGTLTYSDHRLLKTRMKIKWYEIYGKVNKKREKKEKYNTQMLVHNPEKQEEYRNMIDEKLNEQETNVTWTTLTTIVKSTAKEVVGVQSSTNVNQEEYSKEVEELSKLQRDIRTQIQCTDKVDFVKKLRTKRNKIKKQIKTVLKSIRERNIDAIVKEIDEAPNDMKMYKSVQKIRKPKEKKNIVVHDDEGRNIVNEEEKYKAVKEHFYNQLYDRNVEEIMQFIGKPRPLKRKITPEEVDKVLRWMNNNRATGEDGIPVELLKYAPYSLKVAIAKILNQIFEEHKETINVGKSILQPIPKPGKPEGPKKNLRPINLLNVIRKVLSSITLSRINAATDKHISNTQSAYRTGRSTMDVVWAHRFICAKAQLYKDLEIKIVGIDMSSAFDTIHRKNLMDELEKILDEDEQRMCRLLLSKTTITIKFGNHEPETVPTNIGSPQGDGSSGKFFNVEFENALRILRTKMNQDEPSIEHSYAIRTSLPPEMEYADDSDFIFESDEKSDKLKLIVKDTLAERNLQVNDDKLKTH